mgnify:CR=1 FL=1
MHIVNGDLVIAATDYVRAHELNLSTDNGTISVAGTIDASGNKAGRVGLHAGNDVSLTDGAQVFAFARDADEQGGLVELTSRRGTVSIGATSDTFNPLIKVNGGQNNRDTGVLRISASRTADNRAINVAPIYAEVDGAQRIEVIGNRVYQLTEDASGDSYLDATDIATDTNQIGLDQIRTDIDGATGLLAGGNDLSLLAVLDPTGRYASTLHLLAGFEIQTSGNLQVNTPIDFANWRFGSNNEPGVMTLRAARQIAVNNDISDGLVSRSNSMTATTFGGSDFGSVTELMQGTSWGYRLVAGADNNAADPMALLETTMADPISRDIVINSGVRVRTGTGDIDLATAGNLVYTDNQAAIYTMGESAGYGNAVENFAFWTSFIGDHPFFYDAVMPNAGFGRNGGDLRIQVSGDIQAQNGQQQYTDWLIKMGGAISEPRLSVGSSFVSDLMLPTMWTVEHDAFRQALGTLGGGDINLDVGGDVHNLAVMLPTTGRTTDTGWVWEPISKSFIEQPGTAQSAVEIFGGGDLNMQVAGSIYGGTVLVARGDAEIQSAAAITYAQTGAQRAPILVLGDSQIEMTAASGAVLEAAHDFGMRAGNPLVLPNGSGGIGYIPLNDSTRARFFNYQPGNSLAVNSLAGDVRLRNATNQTSPFFTDVEDINQDLALRVYPGSFAARALAGNVIIERGFVTAPDPNGTLELIALNDITDAGVATDVAGRASLTNRPIQIVQSDADVTRLPNVLHPVTTGTLNVVQTLFKPSKYGPGRVLQPILNRDWHAITGPLHIGDSQPSRIISGAGDIGDAGGNAVGFRLFTAEQSDLSRAGHS